MKETINMNVDKELVETVNVIQTLKDCGVISVTNELSCMGNLWKKLTDGDIMTYEEINAMMNEIGLPYAYHHFAEGPASFFREISLLPFAIFFGVLGVQNPLTRYWKRAVIFQKCTDKLPSLLVLFSIYFTLLLLSVLYHHTAHA